MSIMFAASPLLVVALGALLLMLAEAFSEKTNQGDLALGTAVVLLAGAATSIAVLAGLSRTTPTYQRLMSSPFRPEYR